MPKSIPAHGTITAAKPIALRLLPDEFEEINEIAKKERRSLSNMCRLILIDGIEQYKKTGLHPYNPPAQPGTPLCKV